MASHAYQPANTKSGGGEGDYDGTHDLECFDIAQPDPEETLGGYVEENPPTHPSTITHMVKSLMPGQDLTRVTIPSWFLEPRSLLEKMGDTMMHPHLLLQVPDIEDPTERMIAVAKWYISGWHHKTSGVKKPYNPIIGETFAAIWKHDDGSRSQYIAEQVSHRPPVTAFFFENKPKQITINGQVHTKSKFQAPQTAQSILAGGAFLNLHGLDEEYYMTFPIFNAHNLLMGKLRTEVGGEARIVCKKTGHEAVLTFHQKPFWGGDNKMNAVDIEINKEGSKAASISGHWNDKLYIKRGNEKTGSLFIDIGKEPVDPKYVLPEEEQGPWESRRLWHHTTELLNDRPTVDWDAVDKEKGRLEEDQRKLKCHHKDGKASDWKTKLFHLEKVKNPLTESEEEMYIFNHLKSEFSSPEEKVNVLKLSREVAMNDPRNDDPEQSAGLAGQQASESKDSGDSSKK